MEEIEQVLCRYAHGAVATYRAGASDISGGDEDATLSPPLSVEVGDADEMAVVLATGGPHVEMRYRRTGHGSVVQHPTATWMAWWGGEKCEHRASPEEAAGVAIAALDGIAADPRGSVTYTDPHARPLYVAALASWTRWPAMPVEATDKAVRRWARGIRGLRTACTAMMAITLADTVRDACKHVASRTDLAMRGHPAYTPPHVLLDVPERSIAAPMWIWLHLPPDRRGDMPPADWDSLASICDRIAREVK